jgi:predicted P-loop ATPase
LVDADKDTVQKMMGGWIIEVAEMRFIRSKASEPVKAFLTTRFDRVRFAYGRKTGTYPRQSVFVGTWNPDSTGYLNDETGNRRFCPVRLGDKIDVDSIQKFKDQLFAEALIEYRNGYPIFLNDEMVSGGMLESQADSEVVDDWAVQIENCSNGSLNDLPDNVTALDIYVKCLGGIVRDFNNGTSARIGKCLVFLGCKRVGVKTIGGRKARYFNIQNLRKQVQWSE